MYYLTYNLMKVNRTHMQILDVAIFLRHLSWCLQFIDRAFFWQFVLWVHVNVQLWLEFFKMIH